MADELQAKLDELEESIREAKREHVALLDVTGNILFCKSGTRSEVTFSDEEVGQMAGCILTHNHPGGHGFSEADVRLACCNQLHQIRVVTRLWTYHMSPPSVGWSQHTWAAVETELDLVYLIVKRELTEAMQAGLMTQSEANLEWEHLVWDAISARHDLDYDRLRSELD